MLSITDADTTISFATPDDVRQTSEKALNIWIGAFSPLWVPFLTATAGGIGFWSMSQVMKRSLGFAGLATGTVAPDAHLFAKWPGFALPFLTPWSRGWGDVATDADRIAELTHETLSAPLQLVFETEEKLEEAVAEAVATAHESLDLLTPKTDDLFSVADAATKTTEATVQTAEKTVEAATDVVEKTVQVVADTKVAAETVAEAQTKTAADAVAKSATVATAAVEKTVEGVADTKAAAVTAVTSQAKKTADTVTKSTKAVIDPVTETPVVPAVAEATAEKLPLPMADVSPALAPRKPKKPKA